MRCVPNLEAAFFDDLVSVVELLIQPPDALRPQSSQHSVFV